MRYSGTGLIVVLNRFLQTGLERVTSFKTKIFLGFCGGKNPRCLDHRPKNSLAEMDTDETGGLKNVDEPGG